jgi:protein ImuA
MRPIALKDRQKAVDNLRRLLPALENRSPNDGILPFGLPLLDSHLPDGGLPIGALHEIVPLGFADRPAAFGFGAAMLGRLAQNNPVVLATGPASREIGFPYYHGLPALGLEPRQFIWVEAKNDNQILWTLETALGSGAPGFVIGMIEAEPGLHASQRLHLAAKTARVPVVLLYARESKRTSAATTRWRIAAAAARRDRFDLMTHWRWQVRLERCRNGRPGEWLVEWDHVAYRFNLVATLADPAPSHGTDACALGGIAG